MISQHCPLWKVKSATPPQNQTSQYFHETKTTLDNTSPQPTVEVGRLHTLRLESLKLIFQPLHKFLDNKLQFLQVGQDIYFVHDTQYFSNNCLQIISLITHCITIPEGQKLTYTKLTVPSAWKIPENDVHHYGHHKALTSILQKVCGQN